jgi:hypothetical protein
MHYCVLRKDVLIDNFFDDLRPPKLFFLSLSDKLGKHPGLFKILPQLDKELHIEMVRGVLQECRNKG